MVWGQLLGTKGIDDWAQRLETNDPGLQSLTILRFRRFNDQDVEQLSAALKNNDVLLELICSSHAISTEAAAQLGAALQQNSSIQWISIGNSSLGDQALDALVSGGLDRNTGIVHWDLEHKGLSHASAASVARVLQQHPKLEQLDISRNDLTDQGIRELCAVPWANLRRLVLTDCQITHQGLAAIAQAPSISQLHHLDLSHNMLGLPAQEHSEAAISAADGLQLLLEKARQLQSLKLQSTALGDLGVEQGIAVGIIRAAIAAAAAAAGDDHAGRQTLSLVHLDLSETGVSFGGVAALAAAVAAAGANLRLQELLLGGNPDLDDEAICQLVRALRGPDTAAAQDPGALEQQQQQRQQQQQQRQQQQRQRLMLDLSRTGIGAEGIGELARLEGLTQLNLFGCRLGGEPGTGCTALEEGIHHGGFAGLRDLNLTGCGLSLMQLKEVMTAIESDRMLPQLATLELGANAGVLEGAYEESVSRLRDHRPRLDVHWRVADSDDPGNRG